MLSSEIQNNPSVVKMPSSVVAPASSLVKSALAKQEQGVKLNGSVGGTVEHNKSNTSEMSLNEQFNKMLKEHYSFPVAEHTLVAEGYLRVGDTLTVNHPGEPEWEEWDGDDFVLATHDKRLCLKNKGDGTLIFTWDKFFTEVAEWCEAHDEEVGADASDPNNHANSFKSLVVDRFWSLPFCALTKKYDDALDYLEPSDDLKEANILFNEKAVRECPSAPVKKEKSDRKRQPRLGYDLASLACDLNEGEEDEEKEFPLEFFILKREGIKVDVVLKNKADAWLIDAGKYGEIYSLKDAFIILNTQVRAEKNLKSINSSCVGTKIMLSFLKFKGKLVSNLVSI